MEIMDKIPPGMKKGIIIILAFVLISKIDFGRFEIILMLILFIITIYLLTSSELNVSSSPKSLFVDPYHFIEERIPLEQELYVLGTAVPTKEKLPESRHNAVIKRTKEDERFVISNKKESELTKKYKYILKLVLGSIGVILTISGLIIGPWDNDLLLITLIIGFIVSLSVLISGFKEVKNQELSLSITTSKIRSLAMGRVELKGKVKPTETLNAPMTGKKCAGYKAKVKEYIEIGGEGKWITVYEEEKLPIFYLEDETGKVPVDPEKAEIDVDTGFQRKVDSVEELPEPARSYIMEKFVESSGD